MQTGAVVVVVVVVVVFVGVFVGVGSLAGSFSSVFIPLLAFGLLIIGVCFMFPFWQPTRVRPMKQI